MRPPIVQLPTPSDDDLPPVVTASREAKHKFLYDAPSHESPVEDSEHIEMPPYSEEAPLAFPPTLVKTASRFVDPFEAFLKLLKEQGKQELVEAALDKMSVRFKVLAVHTRGPLVALLVDSTSFTMELAEDVDLVLKLRHKSLPSRFIANMPFNGGINLLLFVTDEQSRDGDDQTR